MTTRTIDELRAEVADLAREARLSKQQGPYMAACKELQRREQEVERALALIDQTTQLPKQRPYMAARKTLQQRENEVERALAFLDTITAPPKGKTARRR